MESSNCFCPINRFFLRPNWPLTLSSDRLPTTTLNQKEVVVLEDKRRSFAFVCQGPLVKKVESVSSSYLSLSHRKKESRFLFFARSRRSFSCAHSFARSYPRLQRSAEKRDFLGTPHSQFSESNGCGRQQRRRRGLQRLLLAPRRRPADRGHQLLLQQPQLPGLLALPRPRAARCQAQHFLGR